MTGSCRMPNLTPYFSNEVEGTLSSSETQKLNIYICDLDTIVQTPIPYSYIPLIFFYIIDLFFTQDL